MLLDWRWILGALLCAATGCAGCDGDETTSPTGPGTGAGGGGGTPDLGPAASPKALVRFKGAARLRVELARTLDLPPAEVCKELGLYDCFTLVHRVVLGDTDAFFSAVYEPLEHTATTTPLAVDRVVIAACTNRAYRDFGDPGTALIWSGLEMNGQALADPDAASVTAAIDRLYQRGLGRRAKENEIDHHKQLYADIVAAGTSTEPARDWATLSCFATLTSMEMLFY